MVGYPMDTQPSAIRDLCGGLPFLDLFTGKGRARNRGARLNRQILQV